MYILSDPYTHIKKYEQKLKQLKEELTNEFLTRLKNNVEDGMQTLEAINDAKKYIHNEFKFKKRRFRLKYPKHLIEEARKKIINTAVLK